MLPTFVIGLREGLEAVLVVSIIATFLRRNGASLRPMWCGVTAAVVLSIGVGVSLRLVEQNLPQRQQEAMETVIGLVAVVFVTAMVLWMGKHARFMKRELEGAAEKALGNGTSIALVVMVFLAVLREGFETSVFLLATFQAASSAGSAFAGAVLGILAAILLGYAIFSGGVRLDLGRFFTVTSAFLVLVAAGLVLSALRTGHEAGWVTIGQGRTVDLSWLAPAGSIRAALVSGVLGIPSDPRVVEVLGWACYLVPMLVLTLWPRRLRPSSAAMPAVRVTAAGALLVVAAALSLAVPLPRADVARSAPVAGGGSATVAVAGDRATLHVRGAEILLLRAGASSAGTMSGSRAGSMAGTMAWTATPTAAGLPESLTLHQLLRYTDHRVPVGLDIGRSPGPYDAHWVDRTHVSVTTYDGGLVSASGSGDLVLTLSGGGLASERVLTVARPTGLAHWRVPAAYTSAIEERIRSAQAAHDDRTLWTLWFPGFLVVVATWLATTGLRDRRSRRVTDAPAPRSDGGPDPSRADPGHAGGEQHVDHIGTTV